ncbi:uncharacterized protein LOC142357927 [Convolutriloba macropyga]|uniref:uncharacterized protein LOC142357927 n=1 Tax=Convolutriloba macropyga TaxID=536237 RepID=UPI003F51CC1E
MSDDSNNYYSSYGNRNYGTGYMDPDVEKTSETEDRRIDNSAEQIGVESDSLLKSRSVLIKKWLLAVVIIFNVMLFLLLTATILVGVMKLESIKSKIQRLENENKVFNNYAEEWNLAILQSHGHTNKLASIELMLFYTNSSLWDVETEYKILDFELMQLTSYSHFLWYDVIPSLEKRLIVMEAKVRDNTKDLLLFGDRVDTTHARQSYAENRISLLENSW